MTPTRKEAIREEVREQVRGKIISAMSLITRFGTSMASREYVANHILSIHGLLIKDTDQSLPKISEFQLSRVILEDNILGFCKSIQKDMLTPRDGSVWVKVLDR